MAVLYKGQILKIVTRSPGFAQELEQIAQTIRGVPAEAPRDRTGEKEGADGVPVPPLPGLSVPSGTEFTLRSGWFTVVKTLDPQMIEHWQRALTPHNHRSSLLFCDMERIDQVIPELSPRENLCNGILDRTSKSRIWHRNLEEFVVREFCAWYENGAAIMRERNSMQLFHRDRTAINLFRIRLLHIRTLICTDFTVFNDAVSERLVRDAIAEFLRDGMAVCMITQNLSFHDDMAGTVIFADGTKG